MTKRRMMILGIILVLVIGGFILYSFARSVEPVVDEQQAAWLKDTLIAHRGLADESQGIVDNSISAFKRAVERGYSIELDVSLTKDNKLVVFHDNKLKRLYGIDAYLKDTTYEELSKLRFLNSKETAPLFKEVLSLVDGRVPLLVEVKNEGKVGEMEGMVYNELKEYKGLYAIQSFNPFTVKWFRINAPEVLRGQLSGSFAISDYEHEYAGTSRLPWYKRLLLSNLLLNFESRPNFINYEIDVLGKDALKRLRKQGVPVIGWSAENKEEYMRIRNEYDSLMVDIDVK